jgi:beta-glucanase (GH16 family)
MLTQSSHYHYAAGWANNELQCYTNAYENVRIEPNEGAPGDGKLVIQADVKHGHLCKNSNKGPIAMDFTSAKLTTANKRAIKWTGTHGNSNPVVVTARMKIPLKDKAWPAFWLLPETTNTWCSGCGAYGGWCTSGEIDIMEHINDEMR